MRKQLQLLFTMLLLTILGSSAAWAQEVTYDFTGSDWTVSDGTLSNGTVSITGEGSANFKMSTGYFMMGKFGAYITLPAYDFAVNKIEVVGRSGASASTKQNIFVGDVAVSTETTGVTGSNSYDIDANYQAAGTQYTIKVTSAHNTQITAIKIYKAGGTVVETVAAPTFSPEGGIYTESQEVEINCTTDGATIYYTTDGSTPTAESEEYTGAITVSETTTIKAFAVKDGMNNSAVATATYTIKTVDPNWIDFTIQGFENAEDVTTVTGKNGSVTFAKATGSNAPKWYDTGSAVRIYTNNTITISAEEGKKIESVEFSITSGSMSADGFNVDGSYESNVFTLTAPTNSIVYTTPSNFRLDKIKINLSSDTREEAGLSYSAEEYTATIGEEYEFPTLSNPNSLTVSYASTNEDVATIDATGVITIIAAGETTIKATSEETDVYMAGSASYTLTVTDPNAPGTENNPYTVAQALEAIDALADNGYSATEVYIKGVVSGIKSIDVSQYQRAQYYISDDGTETDELLVYNGYYLGEGVAFTANDQIQVGDEVVVYGKLQKYVKNGTTTPEVAQNNYLVSLDRPNQPKYYVVGYHNNWDNGAAVTENLELKRASDGTLKVSLELGGEGQNGDFKIIKVENDETTAWYGATADGSYWITADNHDNITLVDGAANLHLNTYGAYDFMLDISGDQPKLSVDGDWPRQKYYLISDPDWDPTDMTEMIYNEETSAYETELTVGETAIYFAIADQQMDASTWNPETDWADFNANHRYAIEESSDAYELTKENSLDVQLQKVLGTMKIATPGTYTITLTEDLKLTVTGWPKELPEGNAFVKVTSTDDLTNGYYLIVYEGNDSHASVAFNGGLETLDAASNTIDVTIGGDKIVATDENKAAMFYIDNTAGTLQSESGFYIGKTANSNGLDSSDETQYTNTFSIEDGYAVITASGNCTLRYNYASDQNRFRYYKSGQQAIALYKLTTVEPVEVTLNKYGYATLYYGDMSLTVPEGVTATTYDADVKESVTYAAGDVIPAGEAVVLKGEANAKLNFELGTATAEADANNALMGLDEAGETVAPGDGDYKFYMLSAKSGKVGFYYGAADGVAFQTAAHKAYLVVPTSQAKLAYIFDETTGIQSVDNNTLFATGKAYNLNGQRVDKNYKGVVIVDGKKMINK